MDLPECWTFEPEDVGDPSVGLGRYPAHVWCPAPNGDTVELCRLTDCSYKVEPAPGDEYDEGIRQLCDPEDVGRLMAAAPELLKELEQTAVWLDERSAVIDAVETKVAGKNGRQMLKDEAARFRGRAVVIRQLINKTTGG